MTVGMKQSNGLGIHDMSGNVYEWCADWYGNYIKKMRNGSPFPQKTSARIMRGGSCFSNYTYCRSVRRNAGRPDGSYGDIGFRFH